MGKDDKIHIRLEISRDTTSGELTIMTRFDPNAPNFSKDEDGYFWMPTLEERNFINKAFELISTTNIKSLYPEKPTAKPSDGEKIAAAKPRFNIEEKKPEKIQSPFESKVEKKPADLPPLKKREEEEVFEKTEEESKPYDLESKVKEEEGKGILVKADDQAIDAALKKNEERDRAIVEADEQTIIEKVLSQKKKGKWSKED